MAEEVDASKLEITDELIAERRAEAPGQTPEDMTPWMRPITATIDVMNMWVGRILCLILVPLIAAMVFEVVSRKAFAILAANGMDDVARARGLGPTLWAYDISRMSGGILFMGAAGYALMRGVHIRADFLYRNWSPNRQAIVDAVLVSGLGLAILLMAFAATMIMRLLTSYPWISWLGLIVLIYVASEMMYRGFFDIEHGIGPMMGWIEGVATGKGH